MRRQGQRARRHSEGRAGQRRSMLQTTPGKDWPLRAGVLAKVRSASPPVLATACPVHSIPTQGQAGLDTSPFPMVPGMTWLFSCSVVSDSATPWTAAHQASLSFIISQSLLKFRSFELVMPSNHLILCCPLLFLEEGKQPQGVL